MSFPVEALKNLPTAGCTNVVRWWKNCIELKDLCRETQMEELTGKKKNPLNLLLASYTLEETDSP
jgi:hypothetical protein